MARNALITVSTLGYSCFFFLIALTMTGMSSAETAVQEERHRAAQYQPAGAGEQSLGGLAGGCEPGWLLDIGQPGMSGGSFPSVNATAVYNGSLVAGGRFTTSGGQTVNNIARWNGTAWHPLTAGGQTGVSGDGFTQISALTVYNGSLVVGGLFETAGGETVNNIARWDGAAWHPLTAGGQIGVTGSVDALTVYDGYLVAGGQFTTAGGQAVNRIAQWDGEVWQPLSSGVPTGVGDALYTLTVYDGSLVAGGQFTTAGGMTANRIAQWDGCLISDGACCINGVALSVQISESECVAVGGDFQGEGTDPGQVTCSHTAPTCAGDLNGDGVVGVFDLLELLGNWGTCEEELPAEGCGAPDTGSCFESNGTPYCNDADCCETICDCDPFCCNTEWDNWCAGDGLITDCGAAVLCTSS